MPSAIDDVEGIFGLASIIGIVLLAWWLVKKLGLLASGGSGDSNSGTYPNSPFSPLQNVNGVSGTAAALQRGIAWLSGEPANQIFGPTATGIGGDWWWNHVWKYFDPLQPLPALDYSQAVSSFDASGEAGAANLQSLGGDTYQPTQDLMNYMGWQS